MMMTMMVSSYKSELEQNSAVATAEVVYLFVTKLMKFQFIL